MKNVREKGHSYLLGKRTKSGSRAVGGTRQGLLENDQYTPTTNMDSTLPNFLYVGHPDWRVVA